jgi:hypothetical protein
MKLGMHIMICEPISTACIINSSHQFGHMCIPLSLLGDGSVKKLPWQRIHTQKLKNWWRRRSPSVRDLSKESRWLVLPRTSCLLSVRSLHAVSFVHTRNAHKCTVTRVQSFSKLRRLAGTESLDFKTLTKRNSSFSTNENGLHNQGSISVRSRDHCVSRYTHNGSVLCSREVSSTAFTPSEFGLQVYVLTKSCFLKSLTAERQA